DVPGGEGAEAEGAGRDQSVRHLAAGKSARDRRLRRLCRAVRRFAALAPRGLGRLLHAATLLAHRQARTKLSEAAELVAGTEPERPAHLARTVYQPLAGGRDCESNQSDAGNDGR